MGLGTPLLLSLSIHTVTRRKLARCPLRLLILVLLFVSPAILMCQEAEEGMRFRTGALEVTVNGRLQTLFSTSSVEAVPLTQWDIRRARIEFNVRATSLVSARVQPEFAAGAPVMRDAYLAFNFSPGFRVLAGRAFRPFGLIGPTSSVLILPVERGAAIRGLRLPALEHHNLLTTLGYTERDIGLQLLGSPEWAPWRLSYAVGVLNGPIQARSGDRSAYQLSARARVRPLEPLSLGVGWSRRDFIDLREEEEGRASGLRSGQAWEVDLEYGAFGPGLHLMAEAAVGDADPFLGSRFRAAQVWLAHRSVLTLTPATHLEPVLRLSYGDPEPARLRGVGGTLVTPGLNLYFDPLNRIMLNYDVWLPGGEERRETSLKVMFQMAF